jgi:hypothetical protein
LEENLKGAPWDVRTYTKKKAMQDGEQAQQPVLPQQVVVVQLNKFNKLVGRWAKDPCL